MMQDTARINAGRTPHAFFAKRAVQADTGAAKAKLVTELTEPPLPPIHITQVSVNPSKHTCSFLSTHQPMQLPTLGIEFACVWHAAGQCG